MTPRAAVLLLVPGGGGIGGFASSPPADGGLDGAISTEALAAASLAEGVPPVVLWVSEKPVT